MCGIAGFWKPAGFRDDDATRSLRVMTDRMQARGPDDDGLWFDLGAGVALGHRRLSIIDLSSAGHQPMVSGDGRFCIALNGEIYNYRELRERLEACGAAPAWRGSSDTEVLLACLGAWGVERTLKSLVGMYAFAVWDRKLRCLHLVRDPMGEKPLYYGWQGKGESRVLLFGSELSALEAHPSFEADVDRGALALFMRHNYVPAPHSIYRDINKLMPGQFATFGEGLECPRVTTFWDTLSIAKNTHPFDGSIEEAAGELDRILSASVMRQMVADVPLGAFLSGGIDSSTVVALMQKQSTRPVESFSIGFNVEGYNEAVHAKAVASHLGTDHTELYVEADDAMAVIPQLPTIYSEPFADSSQIPTFLVSRLARKNVTVSLSGDGGDELFGGYNRYYYAQRYWRLIERLPSSLRMMVASAISSVSPAGWNRLAGPLLKDRIGAVGSKAHKGAALLSSESFDALYFSMISHFENPNRVLVTSEEADSFSKRDLATIKRLDPIERMMAIDSVHYLPDDILTKVDRAAMAVSLETRVPMLDPDVVRFAWSLPLSYKIRGGVTKYPLRQVLYRYVPRGLIERPKMGFGVPIADWLRGPLKEWAWELLRSEKLGPQGYFDTNEVASLWHEHQSGSTDHAYRLWNVLMFQAWLMRPKASQMSLTPKAAVA